MQTLRISTKRRSEFLDITAEVAGIVQRQKVHSGVCVIFCPHTTAGLTINENADPDVRNDVIEHLQEIVPEAKPYRHGEGNADAHIKASLMGSSLNIIIENNRLVLGTWQGIYFCEFDGPRSREVHVTIIKG